MQAQVCVVFKNGRERRYNSPCNRPSSRVLCCCLTALKLRIKRVTRAETLFLSIIGGDMSSEEGAGDERKMQISSIILAYTQVIYLGNKRPECF